MAEINIALLGGDKRELEVARVLLGRYHLRCFGLPRDALPKNKRLLPAQTLDEALSGADAVLLPMAGVREDGSLYAPLWQDIKVEREDLELLKAGTPVLVGVASNYLRGLCAELSLPLYEVAEHDLVAIPNAVPTAEGALALLLQETDITINGMRTVVLGFGRVGEAVSLRLRALGAEVTAFNRGKRRLARARAQGFNAPDWSGLAAALAECDAVINTVPAPVLGSDELALLKSSALVIDLASGAGGTDFAAAAGLGVRALHALSLPGKIAPVSAGRILGQVYPNYLATVCGLPLGDDNKKTAKAVRE